MKAISDHLCFTVAEYVYPNKVDFWSRRYIVYPEFRFITDLRKQSQQMLSVNLLSCSFPFSGRAYLQEKKYCTMSRKWIDCPMVCPLSCHSWFEAELVCVPSRAHTTQLPNYGLRRSRVGVVVGPLSFLVTLNMEETKVIVDIQQLV